LIIGVSRLKLIIAYSKNIVIIALITLII